MVHFVPSNCLGQLPLVPLTTWNLNRCQKTISIVRERDERTQQTETSSRTTSTPNARARTGCSGRADTGLELAVFMESGRCEICLLIDTPQMALAGFRCLCRFRRMASSARRIASPLAAARSTMTEHAAPQLIRYGRIGNTAGDDLTAHPFSL